MKQSLGRITVYTSMWTFEIAPTLFNPHRPVLSTLYETDLLLQPHRSVTGSVDAHHLCPLKNRGSRTAPNRRTVDDSVVPTTRINPVDHRSYGRSVAGTFAAPLTYVFNGVYKNSLSRDTIRRPIGTFRYGEGVKTTLYALVSVESTGMESRPCDGTRTGYLVVVRTRPNMFHRSTVESR